MIKKTSLKKKAKFIVGRWAERCGLPKTMQSVSREKYAEKISASLFYGLLSAIAVNFFFQPGYVYSSGTTGFAQVLSAISERLIGFRLSISVVFYAINMPLLVLAWYKIEHKFTVFILITVSISPFFIQIVPEITLTTDPLVNATFGGLVMGTGIGFSLESRILSGGTDIISLTIRKKTDRDAGSISLMVNGVIMIFAGILFGWQYALYSMVTIFVSSRVTNAIFIKQKKMQATIVTNRPEKVTAMIHTKLHREVIQVNGAEGTYNHKKEAILLAIITREEYNDFRYLMKKTDLNAFVSVAENVHIIGRFVED